MEEKRANTTGESANVIDALADVTKAAGQFGAASQPAGSLPGVEGGQPAAPELEAVEPGLPAGAFEIAPGMTAEEMTALFFDDALIEPPYEVWQLNSKGHRYYYKFGDDGTPVFYPSVTTILSQVMPKSPFLVKWVADMGYEEAERYKQERADYGTFMHAQFEELAITREYDLDKLKDKLLAYMEEKKLPADFIYYADDLKKDVLAFAQFMLDYDVKPIAVEIALVHPELNYAGMIDFPCNMQVKPGSEERINAIIDFKSGRKGFYEEMEVQLHMYKMMWEANFPDIHIDRVYNFSPKDWRKKPTYNLKDQTDSPAAKKIPYLLGLAGIEDEKRNDAFLSVSGKISLDASCDLGGNVVSLTLAELVKRKSPSNGDKKEPEQAKGAQNPGGNELEQSETRNEAQKKPAGAIKRQRRGIAQAESETPPEDPRTSQDGDDQQMKVSAREKMDLLNGEIEI